VSQQAADSTSGQDLQQQATEAHVSVLELLLQAAAAGDMPVLQRLLAELGSAAHGADHSGWTALHAAAETGQEHAIKLLIAAGADVNAVAYHPDVACDSSQEQTPPHLATLGRHAEVVQQLLAAGADVDAADIDGCAAFHIAAVSGDSHLVQLLLGAWADVDAVNADRVTPLHSAAGQGSAVVVRLLLSAGAAVSGTSRDDCCTTPLHHAVLKGHHCAAKELLAAGAGPCKQPGNVPALLWTQDWPHGGQLNPHDCTPLQHAAQRGDEDLVRIMLSGMPAPPSLRDDQARFLHYALIASIKHHDGTSSCVSLLGAAGALATYEHHRKAMLAAIKAKNSGAVRQLLAAGVSPNIEVEVYIPALHLAVSYDYGDVGVLQQLLAAGANPATQDRFGQNTLVHAIKANKPRLVRVLLAAAKAAGGAAALQDTVNETDSKGETALRHAAVAGDVAIVRLLLKAGADPNANEAKPDGGTPLHAAMRASGRCHVKVIRQLVVGGARVDAGDRWGDTPLHQAICAKRLGAARVMIKAGAAQAADDLQQTPLRITARDDDAGNVHLLLSASAAVSATNYWGETPLFAAVRARQPGLVEALLDAGADGGRAKHTGRTPLHEAAYKESLEIACLLLDKGFAPVNVADDAGDTPLHIAVQQCNEQIVQLLLDHGAVPDAVNNRYSTPLHAAVLTSQLQVVKKLLSLAPLFVADLKAAIHLSKQCRYHPTPCRSCTKGDHVSAAAALCNTPHERTGGAW
jgi:ankyrin repeat protein